MTKHKKGQLLELFWTYLKIGAFTFGGGYAMISLVQAEIVTKRKWIDQKEFMNMIAISQATPGVIAINTATFVGYYIGGFWGSLLATLGVTIPSFIVIAIISQFLEQFLTLTWVAYAFNGIRAGIIVLIFDAVIKMKKSVENNVFNWIIGLAAFFVSTFTNFSVVYMIIIGGILGIIWQIYIKKAYEEKGEINE